jgi:hypothetical protein
LWQLVVLGHYAQKEKERPAKLKILRVIASMNPSSGGPCQGIRNSAVALQVLQEF